MQAKIAKPAQRFNTGGPLTNQRKDRFMANGNSTSSLPPGTKHGVTMHVDHIRPRSKFPELALALDNLQVLRSLCNEAKSNLDMTEWPEIPEAAALKSAAYEVIREDERRTFRFLRSVLQEG